MLIMTIGSFIHTVVTTVDPEILRILAALASIMAGAMVVHVHRDKDNITFIGYIKSNLNIRYGTTVFVSFILYEFLRSFEWFFIGKLNTFVGASIVGIFGENVGKVITSNDTQTELISKVIKGVIRILSKYVDDENTKK